MNKFKSRFKVYLGNEIAIDYKTCLYFFYITFVYCVYRVLQGNYTASILHMCEIMAAAYFMVYFQFYVFYNFDEAEQFGRREALAATVCSLLYTALSFWLGWFDRKYQMTFFFFLLMLFGYLCMYISFKVKRMIDTENLNKMLTEFKKGESHGEENR